MNNSSNTPTLRSATSATFTPAKKQRRKWLAIAPIALLSMIGILPISGKASAIAAFLGQSNSAELTIIARADGTFDIKEFAKPDQ